jgi:hypothetical protein
VVSVGRKKKWRYLADLSAAYGVNRPLSEREEFGLWLHIDRIRYQRATEVSLGLHAARGGGELERTWFDAVARDESEVDELQYRVNADRMEAAIRSRRGF